MATHTFQIIVTQSGAQATAAAIGQVGTAAQKSASALQFFRQALVLASTVRAAAGMVDLIDAATRMENRLQQATKSTQEFARAQQFVSQISRQTRTDVEANTVTYARLLRSTEGLGLSSEYLEKVMKGLALSVKVGGATSMEARNALIQFSQSLASGALRGDELRSVAEQLPELANAIGKEFGVSGGQLIAFAKATPGILEAERVIRGVANAVPELEKTFAKTKQTLEEGFTAIRQGAIETFAALERGTGVFTAMSNALVFVGRNLNLVAVAAISVVAVKYAATLAAWTSASTGALSAFLQLAGGIRSLSGAMALMQAAFMVNPITVWVAAIAAAGLALVSLYNYVPSVKAAIDNLMSAFVAMVSAFSAIQSAISQSLPAWFTFENVMMVVGGAIAVLIQNIAVLLTAAFYAAARVVTGFISILNLLGLATNETAEKAVAATGSLEQFLTGLLTGKQAATEAGTALTGAGDSIAGMVNPLASAKQGTDALKLAQKALADEVKQVDEGYRMLGERLTSTVASLPGSVEGFNNLARVTKDWEKYTTEAGTATTNTASAATAAKPATDSLAGSMRAVNVQASGAASASKVMSAALTTGAESSAAAAKKVKEVTDLLTKLNPLMIAAKTAGEAAAEGFRAAASAASNAVSSINALAQAYRELAAAKAGANASSGDTTSGGYGGARAAGGPVLSGSTYLVGEKGPELFTPNASGSIIPNHMMQSNGTTAANDNTTLIVRAISRMANAVVASNKMAAESNTRTMSAIVVQNQNQSKIMAREMSRATVNYTETTSGFSGTGFAAPEAYVDPFADKLEDMKRQNKFFVLGAQHLVEKARLADEADARERQLNWQVANKMLPGDEGYMADSQNVSAYTSKGFSSITTDFMIPFAKQLADLKNDWVYGKAATIGGDSEEAQLLAKQQEAIAMLQEQRNTDANYDQFRAWLKTADDVKSSVTDFQFNTPMQGGQIYGFNDPYGLGKAHRPNEESREKVSARAPDTKPDSSIQVSMTVNTPNAESFRQNRAQMEAALAGMVNRANKMAGRK